MAAVLILTKGAPYLPSAYSFWVSSKRDSNDHPLWNGSFHLRHVPLKRRASLFDDHAITKNACYQASLRFLLRL